MNEYNKKIEEYNKNLLTSSSKYLFLVSKSCDYSYLMVIHKKQPLSELYKQIYYEHDIDYKGNSSANMSTCTEHNVQLYSDKKFLYHIPIDENVTVEEMVTQYKLKPEYPMPARVVYKIWYTDDNHDHEHEHKHNSNTCV